MNAPFVSGYATLFHTERFKERNVNENALACYVSVTDIVFGAVILLIQNSDMALFSWFSFSSGAAAQRGPAPPHSSCL
jgi:hypothetical protein